MTCPFRTFLYADVGEAVLSTTHCIEGLEAEFSVVTEKTLAEIPLKWFNLTRST
ncbi:MAG: hypothetical protein ACFFDF_25420 [Candidatus Odinarchaeota archaeon]